MICEDEESQLVGIALDFRNEAVYGQHVLDIPEAKVNLRFLDARGVEIGTGISGACWLGARIWNIRFDVGV
jgi:hypothetical protein